jgi:GxxExxY protein
VGEIIYKEISYQIQGAFFEVYKALGNVHKESVYHRALIDELERAGLRTDSQKQIGVYYRNKKVGSYVPDLVVEDLILIELKCKPHLTRDDLSQFWHYLRGSTYKVGYLVNFGSLGSVELIRRVYDTARSLAKSSV